MIRVQFVIFIFMVALLFLISSCGDDDDDNESDDDDFFPEDDDNDSTDDDSEDDDNVDDDDDSEGSPPKLSNAVAFPDVPAGPDATIIFIFDICDEDGDLGLDSGYEFYWSADDTSAFGEWDFEDYFVENPVTDCNQPGRWNFYTKGMDYYPPNQYDLYLLAWDDAGNESLQEDFTFWIPEESDDGPVITNATAGVSEDNELILFDFDICDPDEDLIGGYLSIIYPYENGGVRYAYPALAERFLSWIPYIDGDISDCENPFHVEAEINNSLGQGNYCFDLLGTDSQHHPSEYFMDLCLTVE